MKGLETWYDTKMNLGLGGIALVAAGVLLNVSHCVTALNKLLLFVHIKKKNFLKQDKVARSR